MPNYGQCGWSYTNRLEIPGVGIFNLGAQDVRVTRGTEGSKTLTVKLGSFTESLGTIRIEFDISLFHVPVQTYTLLKEFAKNDILKYYLQDYRGSVVVNYSGETSTTCIIKSIQLPGNSATMQATLLEGETEYIEQIDLKLLDSIHRLV